MSLNQYIDRYAISKALLGLVRSRLASGTGVAVTQQRIARELDVEQSMISQVENGKKAISKEKLDAYAHRHEMTFGELIQQLVPLVPGAAETLTAASAKEVANRTRELLKKTTRRIELLQKLIHKPKAPGRCEATTFYGKIVRSTHRTFSEFGFPIINAALVFRHGYGYRAMIVNKVSLAKDKADRKRDVAGKKRHPRTPALTNNVPRDIVDAIENRISVRAESLVEEWPIVRPAVSAGVEADDNQRHWEKFLGEPSTEAGTPLKMYAVGVQRNVARSEDAHTVSLVLTFKGDVADSSTFRLAMWLYGQVVQQIHSIELRDIGRNIARLVGISLLPMDSRPHDAIYPNAGQACGEHLEAVVQKFFEKLQNDKMIGPRLATADIWSYDWTKAKFLCLSKYFKMVNPKVAGRLIECRDGQQRELKKAYALAFKSLAPRSFGKTAFILTTRRALIVDRPSPDGSTSSLNNPEMDFGTFVGLPIMLRDRHNDRDIYSVLYVRFIGEMPNSTDLVLRISKIANEFADLSIKLAPPMTEGYAVPINPETFGLIEEPGDVRIVSSLTATRD